MKSLAILAIFAVLAYVSANVLPPTYDGPTYELKPIDDPAYNDEVSNLVHDDDVSNLGPIRHQRLTCSLLPARGHWLTVSHLACAGKCLLQGRKGGRCNEGVCVCRT